MLNNRFREDLIRKMNPGVEPTHEIILKDTVGQFQIETEKVSIGKGTLRFETWVEDLRPVRRGRVKSAKSSTEEEAENTHRRIVAEIKSGPDSA